MSAAPAISESDVARIADAISVRTQLPILSATVDDLQTILRCPSKWATQQEIRDLGVKPYRRGKYRLRDIENAIARRTRG